MSEIIRVAVVGLGFGAEFVPIYLDHPNVEGVAICDADPVRLRAVGDRFNIPRTGQQPAYAPTNRQWPKALRSLSRPFVNHDFP